MPSELQRAAEVLREFALALPGASEDFPWDGRVGKVNRKIFVSFGKKEAPAHELCLTVKLPESRYEALEFPWAEPSAYGLGKHGWVTVRYTQGEPPPVDLFRCWIEESYRTIAPAKLSARLDAPEPASKRKPAKVSSIRRKKK